MKKPRSYARLKEIASWAFIIFAISFLLSLFIFKDKLNNFTSQMIIKQIDSITLFKSSSVIESSYNYELNGESFKLTFLEFGAKNCSSCKRMEKVMSEISNSYPNEVNVVFLNILLQENQTMMKLFGIATIPTQVILNRAGREIFRHNGFISAKDLSKVFLDIAGIPIPSSI